MSVAASETLTGPPYQPEQGEPLQAMDETGAFVSTWITWAFVDSALPALSKARYLTVAVAETVKGAK